MCCVDKCMPCDSKSLVGYMLAIKLSTLCPAKRWINTLFALQKDGLIQSFPYKNIEQCRLCLANSRSLHSLACKTIEEYRLFSAK